MPVVRAYTWANTRNKMNGVHYCPNVNPTMGSADAQAARVAADQQLADVVLQVRGDGELAAVERGVAHARDALVRGQLERDEVTAGAGDDDLRVDDLQRDS